MIKKHINLPRPHVSLLRGALLLFPSFSLIFLSLFAANAATSFTNLVDLDLNITGLGVRGRPLQDLDGNFYFSTKASTSMGFGSVFRMTPTGSVSNFANFGDTAGGSQPNCIIQGVDGNFYGTTDLGGTNQGCGTIFQLTPAGLRTILFTFNGTNGSLPISLTQASDGYLCGVTLFGGTGYKSNSPTSGYGTIFRISTNGAFTNLVFFNGTNGSNPEVTPVQAADGNFYGSTDSGGSDTNLNSALGFVFVGQGTLYRMAADGAFTSLVSFTTNNGGGGVSGLIQQPDGSFYGSTFHGGASNVGTIFRLTPTHTLETLISLNLAAGGYPSAFMQANDGKFYTFCRVYGNPPSVPYGAIFRFSPPATLSLAYSFADQTGTFGEVLKQGSDGNFYGASQTSYQGAAEHIFKLSLPLASVPSSPTQSSGQFSSVWTVVAGQSYQFQYSTDLSQTNWINLGNSFTATNGTVALSDNVTPDPQRLYRLLLLP